MKPENVYNYSPIFFQNIMTSVYGYKLHRQRYGGNNRQYTRGLQRSEFETEEFLKELQKKELSKLVCHAYDTTEYYRNLFDKLGLKPNDVNTMEDLGKIPFLTKEEIRKDPRAFVSKSFKKRELFNLYTSGTTGTPLTVYSDFESRRKNYAFFNRVRSWRNIKLGDKRVTFGGRIIIPQRQKQLPYWRYDLSENNLLMSSYHMAPSNMAHYYKKTVEFQPIEIRGYPSSIYNLALYIQENGLSGIRPKAVFTTAETLFESIRNTIESALQCRITDTYGCTEMAFYVTQCEYGTYHAHPEYGIVETVDEKGCSVKGQPGHLVCTSFVNYAMPLIRYRIGDTVAWGDEKCPCGRQFPVVKEIVGRTDDLIVTPEGRRVGRLDPIFKGGLGIRESQIVQTSRDEIVVKIVKSETYSEEDIVFLSDQLKKRIGPSMRIKFEFLPRIERDENGKFRSVVSLVESNSR